MNRFTRHGGDWKSYIEAYGTDPLDFSASISPLGLPDKVRQTVTDALQIADRYPDPYCRDLIQAIAAHTGLSESHLFCGNGAAELIFRLVLAVRPQRALVTAPTFGEYEAALRSFGCTVSYHVLDVSKGFCLDERILEQITPQTDMVFLCEPNNPTGVVSDLHLRLRIVQRCQEVNAVLVADECFLDFCSDEPDLSLSGQLKQYPNLVILKSLTKRYAMAGLRIGYCVTTNADLLSVMRRSGQPWAVSSLAQAAGIAALGESAYRQRLDVLIREERTFLLHSLRMLGLLVIEGQANYLLFRAEYNLCDALGIRGILVRNCGDFIGLDERWHRIAVRTHEENMRLISALTEVLM